MGMDARAPAVRLRQQIWDRPGSRPASERSATRALWRHCQRGHRWPGARSCGCDGSLSARRGSGSGGYATTIHKSQGSEYPAVVIPVMTQHYAMLQRNLLYTGGTRGKKLVVLVGQKKAVAIAVRNESGRRRWSKLSEWLGSKKSVDPDNKGSA